MPPSCSGRGARPIKTAEIMDLAQKPEQALPDERAEVLDRGGRAIVRALRGAGHRAWWVGGCVRDALMGLPLEDIDIATDAQPDAIVRLFPDARLVGAAFGVCLVEHGGLWYEVATLRRDGEYVDLRRPKEVAWGTLEEDAARRDFTINALYMDPEGGDVVDLAGGVADIRARVLRAVGDPARRFAEDALRLLRAVRFAARFDLRIDPATWEAMRAAAPAIAAISAERVRGELTAMLLAERPSRALRLLRGAGLLAVVLPEVAALEGVEQGEDMHPEGDAFEHTLLCMDNLERRTPTAAWGMLLHDIGKAPTMERRGGRISFPKHEKAGAEMAEAACARLRFPKREARRIADIVARHMKFLHAAEWRPSTMRRFLAAETIEDDLAVHRSDALSSCGILSGWEVVSRALDELRREGEAAEPPPLVDGRDLIALGLAPGPRFKELLDEAQRRRLDGEIGSREEALAWLAEQVGESGQKSSSEGAEPG